MFRNQTIIKQCAKSALWVRLITAAILSGFAMLFIPGVHGHEIVWLIGLYLLSYSLINYTMGFRSWITRDDKGKYILCIRDNSSRANSYLPFEYITHVELYEYSGFRSKAPANYENEPFHIIHNQFSFQGKGLIVRYKLPKYISGDREYRSWQLPAPKANKFFKVLKQNISTRP